MAGPRRRGGPGPAPWRSWCWPAVGRGHRRHRRQCRRGAARAVARYGDAFDVRRWTGWWGRGDADPQVEAAPRGARPGRRSGPPRRRWHGGVAAGIAATGSGRLPRAAARTRASPSSPLTTPSWPRFRGHERAQRPISSSNCPMWRLGILAFVDVEAEAGRGERATFPRASALINACVRPPPSAWYPPPPRGRGADPRARAPGPRPVCRAGRLARCGRQRRVGHRPAGASWIPRSTVRLFAGLRRGGWLGPETGLADVGEVPSDVEWLRRQQLARALVRPSRIGGSAESGLQTDRPLEILHLGLV